MSTSSHPIESAVAALRARLVGALPPIMRTALEPFDDSTIWWKPADGVNPVAVLALHCAGNLRHYIGHHVGGLPYERDRPAEFDTSRGLSKREVIAEFDRAIADVAAVFDQLDSADYMQPSRDPEGRHGDIYEDMLTATVHLAFHVGQAVQLARLRGYELPPNAWAEAHRASGASRSRDLTSRPPMPA